MSKTKLHTSPPTSTQVQAPSPDVSFKVGDRATIKSTHPLFPSYSATITARPLPDAAIVELEDGTRQRLLLEYLEPLLDPNQNFNNLELPNNYYPVPNNYSHPSKFVLFEALSPDEERERHRLELKVERAFYEAGKALVQIRDRRLYRSTHKTFEEYCADRFDFKRAHSYRLIDAATVVDNLSPIRRQNQDELVLSPMERQILPTKLEQVRPLTKLQPEEQRACWQKAVDLADGKVPTGKIVKAIVERLLEKPPLYASQYCSVGEIFRLQRLTDEQQKYNGWWGVALEVENRFTVKCQVYDTTLEIRHENIKRVDMTTEELQKRQEIIERVSRLARCNLDPVVWAMLEVLNRQAYYTDVQMKFLETAEQLYGVYDHQN